MRKLDKTFFLQDAFEIAPKIIGQYIVRNINGNIKKYQITELEIYYGEEDTACHARFGKTKRSKTLYEDGGTIYVYLCYGIHHLLNIVTGEKNHPQAILIRAIDGFDGPGKLTKELKIDKSFNEKDITRINEMWIETDNIMKPYNKKPRVGIDYATDKYKDIKWRYILS